MEPRKIKNLHARCSNTRGKRERLRGKICSVA
jgi:hypothetical protein